MGKRKAVKENQEALLRHSVQETKLSSAKEAIQNFKGNVDKEYKSKIIIENIVGQVSFAID
jgi:hypothetical protein